FLFRVEKNSWIDQARKKQKIIQEELTGFDICDDSDSLYEMIKEEQLNIFHAVFNKLEENCKRILSFAVFDKKSMKEISTIMGFKDEKVAKNQHYRCKKYFTSLILQNQEALNILKN
ncbi:MAG: sigma-70 family RNA polymerase sigma factor, partial [Cytophagaceae bacterium]